MDGDFDEKNDTLTRVGP